MGVGRRLVVLSDAPEPSAAALDATEPPLAGDAPAAGSPRRVAPPAVMEVRVLVLGGCVYLLLAWAGVLWLIGWAPGHLPMGPIRWMNVLALVGLVVVWPAFRLSQAARVRRPLPPPEHPLDPSPACPSPACPSPACQCGASPTPTPAPLPIARRFEIGLALLDWLSLAMIWQAVWLTLWMRSDWPVAQALLADAALLGPALLVAALIAWARQGRSTIARAVAMTLCLAMLLAEPLAMLATSTHWTPRMSPLPMAWGLTGSGVEPWSRVQTWWPHVASWWAAAALAWAALLTRPRPDF